MTAALLGNELETERTHLERMATLPSCRPYVIEKAERLAKDKPNTYGPLKELADRIRKDDPAAGRALNAMKARRS